MLTDQLLSRSLMSTWLKYEKQVHLSRKRASVRNIHQLRISTQMFEAVLSLVNALHATHHSKNLISLITKVRKSLGPLRDIQVEEKSLNRPSSNRQAHNMKEFVKFFSKRRALAKKKATHCLDEISLKNERRRVKKLVDKIETIETTKNKKQIQSELRHEIKKSVLKLNQTMKNMNPDRVKEIHQFRIIAKKLRYKSECLNSLTGESHFALDELRAAQSLAGEIQNDSILLNTLDLFLDKKPNRNNIKVIKIRKRVASHQAKIIDDKFDKLKILKWAN